MDMMDADLYEGTWVTFAVASICISRLTGMSARLPDEDKRKGMMFQAKDPSDSGLNMIVTATDIGTDYDLTKSRRNWKMPVILMWKLVS